MLARQTVWREAREQRKTPADHLAHLVVHGTLHLLGHDHETSDADAERMEALERRILKRLGIADPYLVRDWSSLGRATPWRSCSCVSATEWRVPDEAQSISSDCLRLGRREGAVELGQHLGRQLDVERAEILLHPLAGRRLRDGHHAGLGQHPGDRQLRRRAAELAGDLLQRGLRSSPPWSSGE